MTPHQILNTIQHRPFGLPDERWRYYQEWDEVVFLHWKVGVDGLRKLVPPDLDLDLLEGNPWVSWVAFSMKNVRLRNWPSFPPVSDFHEVNVRTYVRHGKKAGVYFLSMEGGKRVSCILARAISALPYRYSQMMRKGANFHSQNHKTADKLNIRYQVGPKITAKSDLDKWLTERYMLFQDSKDSMDQFDIHHIEWPLHQLSLAELDISYPRFGNWILKPPDITHYSPGVQVIAWDGKKSNI